MCTGFQQSRWFFFLVQDMDTSSNAGEEIEEQAILFHKPKSEYHMKVNKAAIDIGKSKPHLVRKGNRGELLDLARKKVADEGYNFKKGHSRSKVFGKGGSGAPKRQKLDKDMRHQRMDELQEDIQDSTKRISLKEKRVVQAESTRNYKLCDELSEQISELKQYKRQKEKEYALLQKSEKRAVKYMLKKQSNIPTEPTMGSSQSSRSSLSPSTYSSTSPTSLLGGSSSESEVFERTVPDPADEDNELLSSQTPGQSKSF